MTIPKMIELLKACLQGKAEWRTKGSTKWTVLREDEIHLLTERKYVYEFRISGEPEAL